MNRNRTEVSSKQLADTVERRWGTPIERQFDLWEGIRNRPQQAGDSWISATVKAGIFNEPLLKASQIKVETRQHVVHLGGFVTATASMNTALAIARSVKGVISVINHMQFR